jgi:Clp amino terminal domain, pathogenicity island component
MVTTVPELDTLAAEIAVDSPMAGVTAAQALAERLRARADELLDLHVDRARAGGASWSEIGCALGTSKQAAQQRFAALADRADHPAPFGLTGTAADALHAAGAHAQQLGHHYVRPEHLILALLDQPHELAGQTLAQLGVTPARVRFMVQERLGTGDPRPDGSLGVAPQTKRLLEQARAIAKALSNNCAKTEHILLAAISPKLHSPAASLLADCGADGERIRDQLTRTLLREAPELAARLSNRTLLSRVRIRPIR